MRARRLTMLAAHALALAAAGGGCLADPYASLTDVRKDVRPAAAECGDCHVEIHQEWAASAHAGAFAAKAFVDATSDRTVEACIGCHAPDSIYVAGPPRPRVSRREEGVTCVACHLDGGALAGPAPRGALLDPHPVIAERPIYRSAELCGKCHEGTLREWRAARLPAGEGEKRTCQECHMPAVVRKATQATGALSALLVAFEDEFPGRRHTFHLDALAGFEGAVAAALEGVRRDGAGGRGRCDLVLTNRLPHRLPTGDFGSRPVAVIVLARDAGGARLASTRFELRKPLGTALAPLETRRFPLEIPERAVRLALRVVREGREPSLVLCEEAFDLP